MHHLFSMAYLSAYRKNLSYNALLLAMLSAALLNPACGKKTNPEIIASDFIQQVELTIEKKSLVGLRDLVSKNYHDEFNRDHRDVLALASSYLIRSKSIHLFIDLQSAESISDTTIRCKLLVAFASAPIDNRNLLLDLNADFYWFDLDLVDEKDHWRVVNAAWQQAMIEDFFNDEHSNQS